MYNVKFEKGGEKLKTKKIISIIAGAVVTFVLLAVLLTFLLNRAEFMRWKKNLKSSMQNGIKREITVYNINGDEMLKFKAKMDFTYDSHNNMLEYIDADTGKKYNIFLGQTATMVIKEIE